MSIRKSPVDLFWVSTSNQDADCLVFAESETSALTCHENVAQNVNSRAVSSNVTLFTVMWSGFLPRQANLSELRELGFEVLPRRSGRRAVRFAGETYVDDFTLMDEVSEECLKLTTGA